MSDQINKELERNFFLQNAINSILQLSFSDLTLDAQLQQSLELIISVPWFDLLLKGAIYLVEDLRPGELSLKAHSNLPKDVLSGCSRITFGSGFCGKAAISGKIIFSDSIASQKQAHCKSKLQNMGHYSIPIQEHRRTIGLISLYTKKDHQPTQEELDFFNTISNIIAGIVARKYSEAKLKKARVDLEKIVEERTIELKKSKEYFENILSSINEIVIVSNTDGDIKTVNTKGMDVLGYTEDELVSMTISDLFEEEDYQILKKELAVTFSEVNLSIRLKTSLGTYIQSSLNFSRNRVTKKDIIFVVHSMQE